MVVCTAFRDLNVCLLEGSCWDMAFSEKSVTLPDTFD